MLGAAKLIPGVTLYLGVTQDVVCVYNDIHKPFWATPFGLCINREPDNTRTYTFSF